MQHEGRGNIGTLYTLHISSRINARHFTGKGRGRDEEKVEGQEINRAGRPYPHLPGEAGG
jgi:hypothetical protein